MGFVKNGMRSPRAEAVITLKNASDYFKDTKSYGARKIKNQDFHDYLASPNLTGFLDHFLTNEAKNKLKSVQVKLVQDPKLKLYVMSDTISKKTKSASVSLYLIDPKNIYLDKTKVVLNKLGSDEVHISTNAVFKNHEVGKVEQFVYVNVKDKRIVFASHPSDIKELEDDKNFVCFGTNDLKDVDQNNNFLINFGKIFEYKNFSNTCKKEKDDFNKNLIQVGNNKGFKAKLKHFVNGSNFEKNFFFNNLTEDAFKKLEVGKYCVYDNDNNKYIYLIIQEENSFGTIKKEMAIFDEENDYTKNIKTLNAEVLV